MTTLQASLPLATLTPAERFAEERPEVYAEIVRIARAHLTEGRGRLSMKAIFEELRADPRFATAPGDKWKLNNNLTASMARLVMSREPELRGRFETRGRTAHHGSTGE